MSEEAVPGPARGPVYVLLPGPVRSAHDGQLHYIGASALAQLYGVPLSRCVVWQNGPRAPVPAGAVFLRPRADGIYRLPVRRESQQAPPDDGACW